MPPHTKREITVLSVLAALLIIVPIVLYFSAQKLVEKKSYCNFDIIIKNATILTLNKKSEIINNGWIGIKNGLIADLASGNTDCSAKEIIDAKGKIAMPGLINTHSHAAMTLLRGIDDSSNLPEWLKNIAHYENKLTANDVYWGALLGEIEMIKSGTTTFNDMYFYEQAVVNSVKKSGIRAVIDTPFYFDRKDNLKISQTFISTNKDYPTIKLSIAPNPLINFSLDKLQKIETEVQKNNFIVHIHIEEDRNEKENFIKKYKLTPLEMLQRSGLLNHQIVMAHSINFTDDELKSLAKYPNVGISINAKSNFKLSSSPPPLAKMMEYGLTTSIGTDGAASSNSLDMFDQMNFIAFAMRKCNSTKNYCENKNNIRPEKIVRMATIEGAKVLGLEKEVGSLEIGKKADIITINFETAGLTPSYDIYSSLVYSTDGSDVSDSIIDGKIVMRNRKLTRLDEDEVIKKVEEIAKRIASR